jgi:Zn-dependent M32 family carboxypeptidase
MHIIKTASGVPITLDGDLLAIMEALYQEVTAKRELERSFEDLVHEIHQLIEQMDDSERRTYLAESLFLNTVKYENDKLEAYMKKLANRREDEGTAGDPR